jgi:uncharacterized protein (DUF58 family)
MKTIISYILILFIITLYTLYLDATGGLFVLIIFISAIVISSALHIYAVKMFDCDFKINADLVEKGDEIKLKLHISKAFFFLPTVFEIKFRLTEHLEAENDSCSVMLGRREKEKVFILKAKYFGKAEIRIESISSCDILGIFKNRLSFKYNKILERNSCHVKIFPAVFELSQKSELVQTLNDASVFDDNEQSREIPFAFIGFPGYEHRDYAPGDPLKSVNWKLSAKRDRLLVRKPEAYAGGDMVLVLSASKLKESGLAQEQMAIESMLSLARALSKQEILCRVYVHLENEWSSTEVHGESEIEKLRYAFTEYSFSKVSIPLPDLTDDKASGYSVFNAEPSVSMLEADTLSVSNKWIIQEIDGEIIFTRG